MQIKFEAIELKKAKEYIEKLTKVEEEIKKEKRKNSSFFRDLFKFLLK
jgi:malonyl CoA-acyl carrier protein transacylase